MDFSAIKKIIAGNGDKFFVTENGEPELVVMSFGEYMKLAGGAAPDAARPEYASADASSNDPWHAAESSPRPGADFASLSSESGLPIRLEDIRLEDLPI